LLADLKGRAKPHEVEVEGVSCLGRCDRAPACSISRHGKGHFHDHVYAGRPADDLKRIALGIIEGNDPEPPDTDAGFVPFGNQADWQIDPYPDVAARNYLAVRGFLQAHPTPVRGRDAKDHPWLCRLDPAGLLGMGGAGVPAYRKWLDVWQAAGDEKYVVCNGDESEPGTFKDREMLADLPHLVIEGMALAGLAIGANRGILYLRHEYGPEQDRFEAELNRAYELGVLGKPDGNGWQFEIEVFVSPGGYILGEETALLEALEDRRGEPRNKPPFPGTHGLHGQPTLINNVETLCLATAILARGVDWWQAQGAPGFALPCRGTLKSRASTWSRWGRRSAS
jgi:hypothetical protein